ncbi:hypothetical protein E1B28_008410 [Marasmius oreades]|uniref:Uncharacterized protein n=1 Tax=Marasmius oreades TaxID=181124 RepID=A0A9P7US36_9AGAR|nr:uncharacterized protein E1B28_008410 [Marasmius oreades]KAG7092028.1 hypothetical protein E1B28_008410 [Marasmius oreades]
MRAYYRDTSTANLNLPHDSGRTVSEDKLVALGLKFWTLEGTDSQCKDKLRQVGEGLGFVSGTMQEYLWELPNPGAPGAPDTTAQENLDQFSKEFVTHVDTIALVLKGTWYYDFKESGTGTYIRIVLGPKEACFSPRGVVAQLFTHADTSHHTTVFNLYKTSQSFEKQALYKHV